MKECPNCNTFIIPEFKDWKMVIAPSGFYKYPVAVTKCPHCGGDVDER